MVQPPVADLQLHRGLIDEPHDVGGRQAVHVGGDPDYAADQRSQGTAGVALEPTPVQVDVDGRRLNIDVAELIRRAQKLPPGAGETPSCDCHTF